MNQLIKKIRRDAALFARTGSCCARGAWEDRRKGRAAFDVKDLVAGEYNATLRVGFGDVQKTYQGALELTNGTSSGLLKEVLITGEGDNVTTEVLHSYKLDIEVLNKTAVDVKLEGPPP